MTTTCMKLALSAGLASLLLATGCALEHPAFRLEPSAPASPSRPLLCPGADKDLNLTSALLSVATANEDRRSETQVRFRLAGRNSFVEWTAPAVDVPEKRTLGPFPQTKMSNPAPTRADLSHGNLTVTATAGHRTAATGDTIAFGWRLRLRWSDGGEELLAWRADTPVPYAAAVRLKVDGPSPSATFDYCTSLTPFEAWKQPAFLQGSGTPRAQFFKEPHLAGDKLDKDADAVADLAGEGCGSSLDCPDSWSATVSSVSTTGGGQQPAAAFLYDEAGVAGNCLYIPPGTTINDLDRIIVEHADRGRARARWADRAESIKVLTDAGQRGRPGSPANDCPVVVDEVP